MQVNSVNYLGSTSFGKNSHNKKKDCPSCNPNTDNSMVSVPRPLYNKLLGMAMLAMVAGGPVAMTSCDRYETPVEDPFAKNNIPKDTSIYVIPADTFGVAVETPRVAKAITEMVDFFGIKSKTADTIGAHEAIKNGDVIEFGYHDDYLNADYKLSINQELSTKDSLVYDGTIFDNNNGAVRYIRHTITQTETGTVVKKEMTNRGKPPSENPGWTTTTNLKYVPAPDGIKEYKIMGDGSEMYQCKYVPKNETSVSRVLLGGDSQELNNISVTKLKNTDTGVRDVHM